MEKNQSLWASVMGRCAVFLGNLTDGSTLRWCLYQFTTLTSESDRAKTSAYSQMRAQTSSCCVAVMSGLIAILFKILSIRSVANGSVIHGEVLSPRLMLNSCSVTMFMVQIFGISWGLFLGDLSEVFQLVFEF